MRSAATVAVLGSINMDVVLRVARFPRAGETVLARGAARHAGGKGANQAIAAARAGADVRLIGAVGDDDHGRALLATLTGEGIDCAAVGRLAGTPTGVAHILVDDAGENQIVVASGANAVARAPASAEAAVLLAQLETPVAVIGDFFAGRGAGARAILNAAPFDPGAWPLLARADIVVVNAVELAGYAGAPAVPRAPDEAAALAATLRRGPENVVVVTLGARGSVTVGPEGTRVEAGIPARAVDTTGAGDCFCGYLAAGLATGRGLTASVRLANRAAAIAVTRPGAGAAMPFAAEL